MRASPLARPNQINNEVFTIDSQPGLRRHDDALTESRESRVSSDDPLVDRAISYYQTASYDFKQLLLSWKPAKDSTVQVSQQ
ncbi:TPA: hypothetical protein ACKP2V_005106 [Pseudomonas putida]|jgi:hypothetical protein